MRGQQDSRSDDRREFGLADEIFDPPMEATSGSDDLGLSLQNLVDLKPRRRSRFLPHNVIPSKSALDKMETSSKNLRLELRCQTF